MIKHLQNKLKDEDLLNAPKIMRTHCYCMEPYLYDIECLICEGKNITWSEFESHVWCYDCKKDVFLIHRYAGIFGGPILVEVTKMFGIRFDRINIKTGDRIEEGDLNDDKFRDEYNKTWVHDSKLIKYEKMIRGKL